MNPSDEDNDAIILAAYNGHQEVVKILLEDDRVDVQTDNNYVLRLAIARRHFNVVDVLLNNLEWFSMLSSSMHGSLTATSLNEPQLFSCAMRNGSSEDLTAIWQKAH